MHNITNYDDTDMHNTAHPRGDRIRILVARATGSEPTRSITRGCTHRGKHRTEPMKSEGPGDPRVKAVKVIEESKFPNLCAECVS